MPDAQDRSIERSAQADNPEAEERLRHDRCRRGEHCACADPFPGNAHLKSSLTGNDHPSGGFSGTLEFTVHAESSEVLQRAIDVLHARLPAGNTFIALHKPPLQADTCSCGHQRTMHRGYARAIIDGDTRCAACDCGGYSDSREAALREDEPRGTSGIVYT